MMAGAKIILLLTIVLASQAFPAYNLRYFNNILTNDGSKACTACIIYMHLYGRYNHNEQLNKHYPKTKFTLYQAQVQKYFFRIPPGIGFGRYLPLCRSLPGICHAVPRRPKVNKSKTKCKTKNKTEDPVGNQEDLTSFAASTCKPPRRPYNPCRNMDDAALSMCISYHQRM